MSLEHWLLAPSMPQFLSNLSLDLFPQHDTLSFMHRDDSDDSHINMSYFPAVVMNFHSSIQHVFAQNDWGMGGGALIGHRTQRA